MPRIEPLSVIRRSHIKEVLRHAQGDLEEASRILGVTLPELRRLLASHGLEAVAEASRPPATNEEE